MIRILETADNFKIYENILDLITNLEDPNITNVHSIDIDKTRYGQLNIAFDYNKDIAVMINIFSTIQIIAPDNLYTKLKNIIINNYPEYENIIRR